MVLPTVMGSEKEPVEGSGVFHDVVPLVPFTNNRSTRRKRLVVYALLKA